MGMSGRKHIGREEGFTIVELLVVIIVIAILATITIISYSAVTNNAKKQTVTSDAQTIATLLNKYKTKNGAYPASLDSVTDKPAAKSTFVYTYNAASGLFCVTATLSTFTVRMVSGSLQPQDGACTAADIAGPPPTNGTDIQAVTAANCPSTRTRAVDARDNRTYWVQKLADGKCWMLTNLAYAGGGANTYGDAKTIANGTGDGSMTYTVAKYYIPTSGSNVTTEPTAPSIATTGTGQYGYLYNWCAAMGAQAATNACLQAATPVSNATLSICPAGWRLPTGNNGEVQALNVAVNGGSTTNDSGLRTTWLGQYGGLWFTVFASQGTNAEYWTATHTDSDNAYIFSFSSSNGFVSTSNYSNKFNGRTVRCLAV